MGIFFTLLYIVTAYLAPTTLFGDLAQYHIEVVLALIVLVFSLARLEGSRLADLPQTYAVLGLIAAVALSMIFNGLYGPSIGALLQFIPAAIVFFFVVLNFRTKLQLQLLVLILFAIAVFIIYQGAAAQARADLASPWVLTMGNNQGERFFRSRGLGFLDDPNDLAQFLVGLIPCMFLFWRTGKRLANFFMVLLPVSYLLYGMFLTHSRGGMVAILAASIVAGRRKIGILPSVVISGILFAVLTAVGWSGGRDVSAESGDDRLEAWSTGIQLIRSHPAFGVGFQRFIEFFSITAHNSVVVTAAELGMIGLFFWLAMIVTTLRDVSSAATDPYKKNHRDSIADLPQALRERYGVAALEHGPPVGSMLLAASATASGAASAFPWLSPEQSLAESQHLAYFGRTENPPQPDSELRRMASVMVVSLTGFLAAGWFLSRAYTMVLFCYIGIATSVYRLALEREVAPAPWPLGRATRFAALASVLLIAVVYVILRLQHLLKL